MANFQLRLTPRNLSDVAWLQWLGHVEAELPEAHRKLAEMFDACEETRRRMDYNTGSISLSAALALYILARNIQPKNVFEVGTFIGKSTLSIALAMDRNETPGAIYTCDGSNEFHLPRLAKSLISGYPKTTSTAALQDVAQRGIRFDFFHIDGRLGGADIELIERIADPRVVIALDDFEGIEKGVANLSLLRPRPFFAQHILVYPMSSIVLEKLNCSTPNTTAILLPIAGVSFANQ